MKIKFLCLIFLFIVNGVIAQENCNNGIDDNGNGLIDCNDPECQFPANIEKGCNCDDDVDNDSDGQIDIYDPDCASFYGLTFVGDGTGDCSIPPPDSLDFFQFIETPGQTQQNTVDTQSKMAIGDLDGDGIPEVIATSKWNKEIRVISSGGDGIHPAGEIIDQFGTTGGDDIFPPGNYVYELELAIADIDGDGDGEIFSIVSRRQTPNSEPNGYFMVALTYENGVLTPLYDAVYLDEERPGMIAIADFDGDGLSEIYFKNRIYAAETGALLAQGTGDWNTEVNSAPVAVNVLPGTPNLELVCGNIIYNVPDLSNRNPGTPINLAVAQDLNDLGAQFYPKELFDAQEYGVTNYSSTSVADVNGDGNIDVVLSGAVGSTNGNTAIFFWDVANSTYSIYEPPDPIYPGGWPWGTSRPNLGDANGDGQLDILFIAGNQLFVLTLDGGGNLVPLWATPRIINDSRSGIVAVTLYDFENDGQPEIVYRDSQQLVIVDGATGQEVFWSTVCQSHTMTEGPIIADVDGNGSTDITIPCFTSQQSFNINAQIQQQALGGLRIYYSAENLWLPTRKVWNQAGYFVVNVNDDLTIPRQQMDQSIIFGDDPCENGTPGPIRPFNIFLNQAPSIGPDGCPFYPAPDISFVGDNPNAQPGDPDYKDPNDPTYFPAVNVIPPICGDLGIEVEFNIINDGALTISSSIPVSFWDGDPTIDPPPADPATLLYTTNLQLNDFQVGDTVQINGVTFNSTGKAFRLYIVLNDDGSSLPVDPGGSGLAECRIENNIYYYDIIPDPFEVDIAKIQDNIKCEDSAPDNGELRAVVTRNGVEVTDYSDFAFQWYDGIGTASPIPTPDGTSNVLTGLAEGDYSLVVTNTDKGCASIPTDTSIVRIGVDPEITIIENSPQNQCDPPNGELEVFITGGNTGYTFEWFDRLLNPLGISGSVASNLVAGEYIVSVFKDGCTKTASYTLSGPIFPVVSATVLQDVVDCINLNSGIITAEAFISGVPQDSTDYTFRWYEWDSVAGDIGTILAPIHGTGPTRNGLLPGEYAVLARDENTGCETSPPVRVIVQDLTQIPTIVVSEVEPQTSCDPANPNGVLRADGYIGGVLQDPSALTFEWFNGDNTLPGNLITTVSGINGEIAEGIANSGLPYTVRVTTINNCSSTLVYDQLTENLEIPQVSAVTFDNSICDPALALDGVFNGRVETSSTLSGVSITDFSDYTFTWYDGDDITTDPVLTNTSPDGDILYELDAGRYTVTLERNSTSCISNPLTVEIFDIPVLPLINISEVPATNCAAGTPNGQLTAEVDIGGTPTIVGYTFKWFEGVDTSGSGIPVSTVSGTHDETAEELWGNNTYSVLVINDSTGCSATQSYIVTDDSEIPVLSLTKIDNSICDITLPTVSGYNGSGTASVMDRGSAVTNFLNYTFEWFDGPTTADPVLTNTNPDGDILQEIPGGFYTVRVTNDSLGCISDPLSIEVLDTLDLPVIALDETPATNCDPALANGEVTANVGGLTAGYIFKWVEGNDVNVPEWSPVSGTANEIAMELLAGNNYTVKVTNENTGCFNTAAIVITDSSALPIISLTQSPNTICDPFTSGNPFNGSVTGLTTYNGIAVSDYSNYSFNLFEGSDTTGILNNTISAGPADFNALENGFYTVRAYENNLGCYSDPVTIEVLESIVLPAIDITEVGATNCDPSLANGELYASVSGTTIGYTFKWVLGTDTNDPAFDTQPGISGLAAGDTYTVKVTIDSTGCFNEAARIVSDSSTIPMISLNQTPNSICDPVVAGIPYDGTITGTTTYQGVIVSDYTNYYFKLFEGSDTTGVVNNSVTGSAINFIELQDGFYTARAYNTALGCYSDPVTIEVFENFVFPVISLSENGATNCDPSLPNGTLTATDAGVIAGRSFKWVAGLDVNGADWSPVSGTQSETAEELSAGSTYSVKVTINATGCFGTDAQTVSDSSQVPILSLSQTPNTICDPIIAGSFDGTISGSLNYFGNPVADYTPFDFNLYEGTDTTGVLNISINGAAPNFIDLEDGDYTARAYEFSTGCFSDPVTIAVEDNTVLPNILITREPNSSCDDAQPNGNIQAFVDVLGNTADHDFTWYDGSTVTPGNETATTGAIGEIITLPGNQNYTVEAVSQITGCVNTLSTFLNRIIPTFDISLAVTDIIDCNTPGSILATIDSSGTGPVADYSNYVFYWYRGDVVNPGSELSETSRNLTEISPGVDLFSEDYTVYAENTYTHCITNDITGFVAAPSALYTIDSEINFYPSDCNTSEGAITAWVDDGSRNYNYNFYWYEGRNINPGSNFYTDPPVAFNGGILNNDFPDGSLTYLGSPQPNRNAQEGPTIYNLGDGVYSVVVEDRVTGCQEYIEIALPSIITPPTLLGTVDGSTLCPYTIGDGEVTAAIQPDSLIAQGLLNSDYDFYLYDGISTAPGDLITGPLLGAPDMITFTSLSNTLAPGYYTVVANEKVSGSYCPSVPLTLEIEPLALPPVVSLNTALINNTSCDSTMVNGQIELLVAKDPEDLTGPTTYDLTWTSTSSTTPANSAGVPAGVQGPYTGLNLGVYDVTVVDVNSTCETTESYELYNEPPEILVDETTLIVTDKYFCVPSGHIEITNIEVGGNPEPLSDFFYDWYDGVANLSASNPIGPPADTERLDSVNYNTIHEGTYYVVVTKDPATGGIGAGCSSAPLSEGILDRSIDPTIVLMQTANLACDSSFATGTLTLTINTGGSVASDYEFTINSTALAGPINGFTNDDGTPESWTEINLGPGQYNVSVRDVDNECTSVNNMTVNDNPAIPYVQAADLTILHQAICDNDGSITVNAIRLNGVAEIPGTNPGEVNYIFSWYEDQPMPPDLGVAGNVLDTTTYPLIEAGAFYFTALRDNNAHEPGEGCETAPFRVDIDDISIDPTLALSQTANQACDLSFATGTLTLNAITGGVVASNYEYTITSPVLGGPLNGFTDDDGTPESWTEINLGPGQYNVQINDVENLCTSNGVITINDNPSVPYVESVDLTILPQEICANDGSITVNSIRINGVPETPGANPGQINYVFTWYEDQVAPPDLGVAGNILDIGTYPSVQAGTYYFTALRDNDVNEPGEGCETAPFLAIIEDTSVDPLLALISTANQSCDTSVVANGTIDVVITPGSNSLGNFNYTWISFPTSRPAEYTGGTGTVNEQFIDLTYGQYNLEVEDEDTKCTTTQSVTINNNPYIPVISNYLVNDQSVCFNDGSITIVTITPGDTSEYDFSWYEGVANLNNNNPIAGVTGSVLDTTNFANIQAGDFYFTAIKTDPADPVGFGCTTSPVRATIRDVSIDPYLDLTPTANENCDLSFANGTLTALATTNGIPGPSYSYTLTSTVLGSPVDSLTNDSEVIYTELQPGNYNVLVIDDNSLCTYNRDATIDDSPVYVDVNDVLYAVNDQTICAPDGSVIINDISDQGISQPLANYVITWFEGESNLNVDNPIAGVVETYLDTTNHPTIGAGAYFFTVTKATDTIAPGEGCESAPLRADILDRSTDPNVNFAHLDNTSCDVNLPNGEISAIAFENDGTDTDAYTFTWMYNGNPLPPGVIQLDSANTSVLSNAPEGDYQITVINASRTQCQVNSGSMLDFIEIEPNIIVVDVTDPLDCNPTGQLEVTEIWIGGMPANVNDFEYEWYQGNFTPGDLILDSLGNPVISPLLQNQYPEKYYVMARNISTACESNPKEAEVTEANIVYPEIYVDVIAPQTSCDPLMPNAALLATVDGGNDDTNPNYQFEWFNSLDGTGPVIANSSSIYGLGADNFSVTVLNLITNCSSTDYYITEDAIDIYKPVISVASSPLSNCVINNGTVSAEVLNIAGTFEFNWYIGDTLGTSPDFTGPAVSGLPDGLYTVTATEMDSTFCVSDPVVVEVRDERMNPVVTIIEDNPMTFCWDDSPNGQFTATVNGMVGGYTFEWYNDVDTTGLADYLGSTYSGLTAQTYTLVVTNNVTQCLTVESRVITDSTVAPPMPDPEVVQHLQNCLEPDGWVRTSVGGDVINYTFDWYDGATVTNSPDHTGINYRDLWDGEYTVTAMDMVTGCISPGVTVEVLDLRELPAFTYEVVPANCERTNGSIEIIWENDVPIDQVIWIDPVSGGQIDQGSAIYNYPPGVYGVIVTSIYGCVAEDEAEISIEIFEFNGISANGDGRNDYFEIACITLFPYNNVKIFNRAGQLVYEADNYNNADVAFRGVGENGMYLMGKELPDGTYFYIIDKGDGSEPIPGFLELIR